MPKEMKVTYKNTINMADSGEYFYLGEHLTIEKAQKKFEEWDNEMVVYGVNHVYYRTGWLPKDVRQDDERTHGWWIIEQKKIMVGKATELLLKKRWKNEIG